MTDTTSPPAPPPARGLSLPRWMTSPLLRKGIFLFVLILLFLLPLQLVSQMVGERAWRQYEVEQEIGTLCRAEHDAATLGRVGLDRLTVETGLVLVTADLVSLEMRKPAVCPRS